MAKSPKTFTSHSPPRARTLSGPATRRRWTRELLQSRNPAFGPNGVPTTSRQTSATRTDTTSRLPISLGSTNKRYEPSTHLRPADTGWPEHKEHIMKRLDNKVAIVTGASKGIGAGIAKAFGAEGAAVVVNYARDHEGAERVVREITGKGGRAIAVQGDVAQRSDAQRLVAEAKKAFGRLDVLVNNAGVFSFAPFEQFSEQEFHRQFNTNVLGTFLMIEAA